MSDAERERRPGWGGRRWRRTSVKSGQEDEKVDPRSGEVPVLESQGTGG